MQRGSRFKSIVTLTLACVAVVFLSGCTEYRIRSVVENYFKAVSERDYEKAYSYLSESNQHAVTLHAYKSVMDAQDWFKDRVNAREVSYTVKHIEVDQSGDSASVEVEVVRPDAGKAWSHNLSKLFGSGEEENDKLPLITETVQYQLHKEDKGWRIYFP